MARLIVSTQVSLDGVTEAPERWAAPFWDDPAAYRYALDELRGAGALLLGRRTYEGFLGYWPQAPADDPMTRLMNELPKYVASTTLATAEWNATVAGDPAAAVDELKRTAGGDILLLGSGRLVHSLAPHGLIDEYRLRLMPAIAGGGRRLFPDAADPATLRLTESRTLPSGVAVLFYATA